MGSHAGQDRGCEAWDAEMDAAHASTRSGTATR
ncbi:hypothetical protein JOF36_007321 [Pseudonocardia parietis]|uniref:Uncharacterized protein n=1 Tax=Pseudonocardia parietis TaxID=570936 RepID=A0ABS4W5Q9_9PSEU|nr:hypothetical protein [Pseudonocardia parietis]